MLAAALTLAFLSPSIAAAALIAWLNWRDARAAREYMRELTEWRLKHEASAIWFGPDDPRRPTVVDLRNLQRDAA